jgi:hypothetical protein
VSAIICARVPPADERSSAIRRVCLLGFVAAAADFVGDFAVADALRGFCCAATWDLRRDVALRDFVVAGM